MKWAKRNEWLAVSDCGRYRVARWVGHNGDWFLLSYRNESLGWHQTPKAAQHAAEQHKEQHHGDV